VNLFATKNITLSLAAWTILLAEFGRPKLLGLCANDGLDLVQMGVLNQACCGDAIV